MTPPAYRRKRKRGNPGPAWAWPYTVALLVTLVVWAVWFVNSGAVRP